VLDQPGAALVAEMCHLDKHYVLAIWVLGRGVMTTNMRIANRCLSVGGKQTDVEMHEIPFRTMEVKNSSGEEGHAWLRFVGAVRRGSSVVYLGELPVTFTKGAGQGGGGAISEQELWDHMRADTDFPVVQKGSIVHTDRVKSYAHLHRCTGRSRYAHLGLWRTWVHHSFKKAKPRQFCRLRRVILKTSGEKVWRKGDTQKLDGYWPLLHRKVSRKATRTELVPYLRDMVFFTTPLTIFMNKRFGLSSARLPPPKPN
jgi:hypothetical protein